MKMNILLKAFFLLIINVEIVQAESIVLKRTEHGMEALSDHDIATHGDVINQILEKYQWPMCQMLDLTPEEQHELLSPQGNEEYFLERKLNEVIPAAARNFEFQVIFIPTTLYQLFLIKVDHAKITKFDLNSYQYNRLQNYFKITKSDNIQEIYSQFCEYEQKKYSNKIKLHKLFIEDVFHKLLFLDIPNSLILQRKFNDSIEILIQHFIKLRPLLPLQYQEFQRFNKLEQEESKYGLIKEIIECECKAHQKNKALLIRGSSIIEVNLADENKSFDVKIKMIASTYRENRFNSNFANNPYFDTNPLYSISFSSSLFEGFAFDPGACAYCRINGYQDPVFGREVPKPDHTDNLLRGFILFINKKDYYTNKNNHLLFIPPSIN